MGVSVGSPVPGANLLIPFGALPDLGSSTRELASGWGLTSSQQDLHTSVPRNRVRRYGLSGRCYTATRPFCSELGMARGASPPPPGIHAAINCEEQPCRRLLPSEFGHDTAPLSTTARHLPKARKQGGWGPTPQKGESHGGRARWDAGADRAAGVTVVRDARGWPVGQCLAFG